jgi:hypothetical protein
MRGVKTIRSLRTVAAGHAFVQNLRRGHYEITLDVPVHPASGSPSTTRALSLIATVAHRARKHLAASSINATVPTQATLRVPSASAMAKNSLARPDMITTSGPDQHPLDGITRITTTRERCDRGKWSSVGDLLRGPGTR